MCPALTRVPNIHCSPIHCTPTVCRAFARGQNGQNCFLRPQAPEAGLGDLVLSLPATRVPGLHVRCLVFMLGAWRAPTSRPFLMLFPPPGTFSLWALASPCSFLQVCLGATSSERPPGLYWLMPGPQVHPLLGLISLPNTWQVYIPHMVCEPPGMEISAHLVCSSTWSTWNSAWNGACSLAVLSTGWPSDWMKRVSWESRPRALC